MFSMGNVGSNLGVSLLSLGNEAELPFLLGGSKLGLDEAGLACADFTVGVELVVLPAAFDREPPEWYRDICLFLLCL